MKSIVADVDHTILGTLTILDEQHSAFKINITKGEMSHFLHPQAAAEHNHEHSPIPMAFQIIKEDFYLLVFQMFGKPPRQLHDIRFLHRVDNLDSLFV
jgi:hypothetical protein